ncbi:MAG: flagellar hook-basal body complex protein FliE [Deltaproteobacteria bacterium]|nr:flagellar hook-basal body complex protein FliE [Deltaproteobacteria bacterium]
MDGIRGIGGSGAGAGLKAIEVPGAAGQKGDFSKTLKDAIEKVDELQKEADKSVKEFASGKGNLEATMVAMEKASLSFQLMVQVKNKIVAAYEDIMRMQV